MTMQQWKAVTLNRLFESRHGIPSNITAETVRHGETTQGRACSQAQGFSGEQLRRKGPRKWKGLAAAQYE